MPVHARVKNGRLLVDEPTDLPEGTELTLVPAGAGRTHRSAAVVRYLQAHRERPETDEEMATVRATARRALASLPWDDA